MVTRPGLIAPEIAETYGRSIHTVTKEWMQAPDWPASRGRRGQHLEFERKAIAAWVKKHVQADLTLPIHRRDPQGLITRAEIAEETGLSPNTVRADLSKGRLTPKEGHEQDVAGTPLWRRGEIAKQVAGRRRRKPPAKPKD
jgi:DNA-binding CsgD family transcriptional regulator